MTALQPDETRSPIFTLVTANPARARALERFGIDYCCHGQRILAEACAEKSLDVEEVLRELAKCDADPPIDERDWAVAPLAELARHIVETHHTYLRRELPRLEGLLDRVIAAHGAIHAELNEVRSVFAGLKDELMLHMAKEERVLFPMIVQLEDIAQCDGAPPSFHCGSILNPIGVMEGEHEHAGKALATIRSLTGGYVAPAHGCPTYVALLAGVAESEADLHRHIHKENNILFPKAAALESRFREHRVPSN